MDSVLTDNKVIYLYHPNHDAARRIDLKQEGAVIELENADRSGWSRIRFAQMLYHPRLGSRVAKNKDEVAALHKSGWEDTPIVDATKSKDAHPDTVHAHHNDTHRQIMLANEASKMKK